MGMIGLVQFLPLFALTLSPVKRPTVTTAAASWPSATWPSS